MLFFLTKIFTFSCVPILITWFHTETHQSDQFDPMNCETISFYRFSSLLCARHVRRLTLIPLNFFSPFPHFSSVLFFSRHLIELLKLYQALNDFSYLFHTSIPLPWEQKWMRNHHHHRHVAPHGPHKKIREKTNHSKMSISSPELVVFSRSYLTAWRGSNVGGQ